MKDLIPDTSSIRDIRYLTLQGGGMKGIGYVGAVEELERQGILAQLEEVAGSSAGGLMATLIAIGCTPEELKQEMVGIDFRAFQDKQEPGWVESAVSGHAKIIDDVVGLAFSSDLGMWRGDALRYWLGDIVARKTGNPNITFKELAELTKIPGSQFKKLTLTGSNISTEELEYYNATLSPDMRIVDAARISAGFPVAYKPVTKVDQSGKKDLIVDGGLLENLPDVFNKEPYILRDGLNGHGGNPKAFALSFVDGSSKDQHKKIESKIPIKRKYRFGKAIVEAKMSEANLQKKYGANIAFVDTVGVGTLEFDASQNKREKLVESGKKAVEDAISNILKQEKRVEPDYSKMPVEELIRRETALNNMRNSGSDDTSRRQLIMVEKALRDLLEQSKITEEQLHLLRKEEHDRLSKIAKRKDVSYLDDQELSYVCNSKMEELKRIKQQLSEKIEQFVLAKEALEYNQEQIISRFEQDGVFRGELELLNNQEKEISENIDRKIKLNLNMEISPAEKSKQNILLDQEYKNLQLKKIQHLTELVDKYNKSNDEHLTVFFENLLNDSGKLDFSVPRNVNELKHYFSENINLSEHHIETSKKELQKIDEELAIFKQHKTAFLERKNTSANFSELVAFKKELDKSIQSKTTPLVKLHNFLIEKAPKFKKVITPFLEGVAFVSFAAWAIPAAPIVGVAKAVQHFSVDRKTKKTANSIINFFSCSDLKLNNRLRNFRNVTTKIIESNKASEYLPKLYDHYFNGTNVRLDDFVKDVATSSSKQPTTREQTMARKPLLSITNRHVQKTSKPEKKKPDASSKKTPKDPGIST